MKSMMTLLALFATGSMCLPLLVAQETTPEEKKTVVNPSPKAKLPTKPSEMTVRGGLVFRGRITEVRSGDMGREILVAPVDPQKLQDYNDWDQKEQMNILKAKFVDPQRVDKYKDESKKKMFGVYSGEPKSVAVTDILRIRTSFPPTVLDAKGTPKKLSPFDLSKLKNPQLPGYAADVANLRVGQIVDVTTPKPGPAPKTPAKKDFIGVDPTLTAGSGPRIDAWMIYVVSDTK